MSFVEAQIGQDRPPVFWRLVPPDEDMARFEEVGPLRRRSDSNTLEIDFSQKADYPVYWDDRRPVQEFEGMVRKLAVVEDERDFRVTDQPLPAGVGFELESRVPRGTGTMLEVIGPGGRATAFRGVRGMTRADITIRRRIRWRRGMWRRPYEILRPLEQALGEDFLGLGEKPTVRAAFGYFELSKYEPQSLMRPVFLFAIEQEQGPEGQWPGFQRIVISPATTAGEFDMSEGLGMWAESIRCSG